MHEFTTRGTIQCGTFGIARAKRSGGRGAAEAEAAAAAISLINLGYFRIHRPTGQWAEEVGVHADLRLCPRQLKSHGKGRKIKVGSGAAWKRLSGDKHHLLAAVDVVAKLDTAAVPPLTHGKRA